MKKNLTQNKLLLITYILMGVFLVASVLIAKMVTLNPLSLTIVFGGFLLVPGFSLARIFKINFINDKLGQLILWLTLGLVFLLGLCGVGMFIGLNITFLSLALPFILLFILILALVLDLSRPVKIVEISLKLDWKKIFSFENILTFVILIFSVIGILATVDKGSLIRGGDPDFHLSIIRKAFDGLSISSGNLGFIKSDTNHVAYGIPVWHILLALFTKFCRSDILVFWKNVSVPLGIFSIMVWYWLSLRIFSNRFIATLAWLFFLLHIFNLNGGYYFTCLPLPDTLNTFLLFPLSVALSLKFIFEKETNYKVLIVNAILVVLMTAIHLTQYFYFLMAMTAFVMIWSLTMWQDADYKQVLKRIGWVFAASFLIFLPLLALLELKSRIISDTFRTLITTTETRTLRYDTFDKWDIFFQYTYIFAPLILLFIKKQPRTSFLLAILIITPIIYWPPISFWAVKFLDYILVNRLLGSITWNYLVFALFFGFFVLLIDRLVTKFSVSKFAFYGLNLFFVLCAIFLILAQIQSQKAIWIYQKAFSTFTSTWLGEHHIWLIIPIIIISITVFVWSYFKPKIADFFTLSQPKNWLVVSSLILMLMIIFTADTYQTVWGYVSSVYKHNEILAPAEANKFKKDTIKSLGGQAMIDFVQTQLPPNSIFLVPGSANYTFPVFVDQFMVAYPRTAKLDRASLLYEETSSNDDKMRAINEFQMNYILLYKPENQNHAYFDQNPQYFTKVFSNTSAIYQVLPKALEDAKKFSF